MLKQPVFNIDISLVLLLLGRVRALLQKLRSAPKTMPEPIMVKVEDKVLEEDVEEDDDQNQEVQSDRHSEALVMGALVEILLTEAVAQPLEAIQVFNPSLYCC